MGCGKESKPNNCDTPGWKIRNSDSIENDIRGFKQIFLKAIDNRFCLLPKTDIIPYLKNIIGNIIYIDSKWL